MVLVITFTLAIVIRTVIHTTQHTERSCPLVLGNDPTEQLTRSAVLIRDDATLMKKVVFTTVTHHSANVSTTMVAKTLNLLTVFVSTLSRVLSMRHVFINVGGHALWSARPDEGSVFVAAVRYSGLAMHVTKQAVFRRISLRVSRNNVITLANPDKYKGAALLRALNLLRRTSNKQLVVSHRGIARTATEEHEQF